MGCQGGVSKLLGDGCAYTLRIRIGIKLGFLNILINEEIRLLGHSSETDLTVLGVILRPMIRSFQYTF